jgi:ubiquitin C-terminal hydrolase
MLKKQIFAELPTILRQHLQRFDATTNKNIYDPIYVQENWIWGCLPHWRDDEQTSVLKSTDTDVCDNTHSLILYDLYGTVNHSGSIKQGHYDAEVKIDDIIARFLHWVISDRIQILSSNIL